MASVDEGMVGQRTEGNLTWGSEHTIQYADDVLQNYTPDTYIILLTNVTQ